MVPDNLTTDSLNLTVLAIAVPPKFVSPKIYSGVSALPPDLPKLTVAPEPLKVNILFCIVPPPVYKLKVVSLPRSISLTFLGTVFEIFSLCISTVIEPA